MAQAVVTLCTQPQAMAGWLRLVYPVGMTVFSFAEQALATLRPLYPEWQLWVVYHLRPNPDLYCARRHGEAAASVWAESPEDLIENLRVASEKPASRGVGSNTCPQAPSSDFTANSGCSATPSGKG
jgi:hypothetical protein